MRLAVGSMVRLSNSFQEDGFLWLYAEATTMEAIGKIFRSDLMTILAHNEDGYARVLTCSGKVGWLAVEELETA